MAVTDPSFRCSHASEAAGEPLLGTASTITNWLLVEHPGPWGERALHHARLPPDSATCSFGASAN